MLLLKLHLGESVYALEARDVVEVLPLVSLHELPGAAAALVGAFNYHGELVPVVDLSVLVRGCRAERRLSTRVILVRVDGARLVGLIAERVTETIGRQPADFISSELGSVALEGTQLIRRVELERWLASIPGEALRVA